MKRIMGIVFDFDGVVVDSERHWPDIENPYLRKNIPTWKDQYYAELTGRSLPEVHEYLKSEYGFRVVASQYFRDYEDMALELYHHKTNLLPGLIELLDYLEENSLSLAIASSSKRDWIDLNLESTKLTHRFDIIVSAHDKNIRKGKPAPDVYLAAAKLLQQAPQNLYAVEDSKSGVAAAKAAGHICIGLRNGFNEEQDLSEADLIANGHTEILKIIKEKQ